MFMALQGSGQKPPVGQGFPKGGGPTFSPGTDWGNLLAPLHALLYGGPTSCSPIISPWPSPKGSLPLHLCDCLDGLPVAP